MSKYLIVCIVSAETIVPHVKYTFFHKKNKKFYFFNDFFEEKI